MNQPFRASNEHDCRLCGDERPLHLSHILPAFVFRDLKRGSATGHMRFSENPNVRVQDGIKQRWLCSDCEQKFSAWERKFANEVMKPWNEGALKTRYDDWMLKFCVSVSWRTLLYAKGRNPNNIYSKFDEERFREAETTWREFLLDKRPHPGGFEQHFLNFDVIDDTTVPDLPSNFNRFMLGSIMMDIVGSEKSSYVWSKLGRFQIFGTVNHGPNKWDGTKIHVKHGELGPGTFGVPPGILDLWKEKAAVQSAAYRKISNKQHEKIDAASTASLDRLSKSRTFRAMQADAKMFGESVIIRPIKPA